MDSAHLAIESVVIFERGSTVAGFTDEQVQHQHAVGAISYWSSSFRLRQRP